MKRTMILCAVAASALTLAACQRQEAATADANPGQTAPVNAAQDAMSTAVGQTSAATMGNTTAGFVSGAAMSDMYEIQAGQMAQTKGMSADVKAFGKMMVTEHTAMSNSMKPMFMAAGQTPPTELDQRRKGLLDNLTAASGADFDRVYLAQQEAAHAEAHTLAKAYADGGDNADLKAAATKAIPKIQMHHDKVKELRAKMG